LVPFGGLGILEGAVVGVVVGITIAWFVSRRARRKIGA
jgi:hypothetical protein